MPRVSELCALSTSENVYFQDFDNKCRESSFGATVWLAREKALQVLDAKAWAYLKKELLLYLPVKHDGGRGWSQFINILNQAYYLLITGVSNERLAHNVHFYRIRLQQASSFLCRFSRVLGRAVKQIAGLFGRPSGPWHDRTKVLLLSSEAVAYIKLVHAVLGAVIVDWAMLKGLNCQDTSFSVTPIL